MGAFVYTWSFQPGVFIPSCGSGGTGRRASLRSLWPQGREGSNPFFRTNPESAGTPAPRLAHCTPLRPSRLAPFRSRLESAWTPAPRLAHCTPLALRGSLRSVRARLGFNARASLASLAKVVAPKPRRGGGERLRFYRLRAVGTFRYNPSIPACPQPSGPHGSPLMAAPLRWPGSPSFTRSSSSNFCCC